MCSPSVSDDSLCSSLNDEQWFACLSLRFYKKRQAVFLFRSPENLNDTIVTGINIETIHSSLFKQYQTIKTKCFTLYMSLCTRSHQDETWP